MLVPSRCRLAVLEVREGQGRIDDGVGFLVPPRCRLAVPLREDQLRIDDGVGSLVHFRCRLAVLAVLGFLSIVARVLPETRLTDLMIIEHTCDTMRYDQHRGPRYDALVCDDAFTAGIGGDGAWAEILGDAVALTPAFADASQVGAPPNVVEALVYPNETAACLAQSVPRSSCFRLGCADPGHVGGRRADRRPGRGGTPHRPVAGPGNRTARRVGRLGYVEGRVHPRHGRGGGAGAAGSDARADGHRLRPHRPTAATLDLLRSGEITQRHATELADATRSLTPETADRRGGAGVGAGAGADRHPVPGRGETSRAARRRPRPRKTRPIPMRWRSGGWSSPRSSTAWPNYGPTSPPNRPPPSPPPSTRSPTTPSTAKVGTRAPATNAAPTRSSTCAPPPWATRTSPPRTGNARRCRSPSPRPPSWVWTTNPGSWTATGPSPPTMARHIATDPTATWRRLLTDDEGRVLHAGTTTYRPPAHMTRTVIARDVHCMFPGCRKKARHNDLDHIQAFKPGDQTTTANLMSLCRRHHRFKHDGELDRRTRPPNRHHHLDRPQRPHIPNPTARPTHHDRANAGTQRSRPVGPRPTGGGNRRRGLGSASVLIWRDDARRWSCGP